jgi:CTP:molybdopterin cytidylyltransferase MocA
VIADLVDGVASTGSRCGWVEYDGERGHPIVLAGSVFNDVRTLTGTKALWPFFSSLPVSEVFTLLVDGPRPVDVNTRADYERANERRYLTSPSSSSPRDSRGSRAPS